jgi:hypothetical protein
MPRLTSDWKEGACLLVGYLEQALSFGVVEMFGLD